MTLSVSEFDFEDVIHIEQDPEFPGMWILDTNSEFLAGLTLTQLECFIEGLEGVREGLIEVLEEQAA